MSVTNATVKDVKDGCYILECEDGSNVKLPVGIIEVKNGELLQIAEDQYLKLIVQDENNDNPNGTGVVNNNNEEAAKESIPPEKSHNAEWMDKATKLLIGCYKENKKLVENRRIKTMKKMWDIIKTEINNYEYSYTSQQCESKWKSLERAFKNKLEHNKKTGRGKKSCPYERELGEIFLEKTSVFPPCVMDAVNTTSKAEMMERSNISLVEAEEGRANTPSPTISNNNATPKSGLRSRSNVHQELQNLRKAIEKRTEEKGRIDERKAEQRDKMIKEMERKNYLLEKLLDTIK